MRYQILAFATLLLLLGACQNATEENNDTNGEQGSEQDTTAMMDQSTNEEGPAKVTLIPWTGSSEFPDASIKMTAPEHGARVEAGTVKFAYEIKNFTLGEQTAGAGTNGLANSPDGQHIHVIINNMPYMAKYKPELEQELDEGNYVVLSFLSRSYHESLKGTSAHVLHQFKVGDKDSPIMDLTKPLMFYSRPKGTYEGADTRKILLDFYLVNVDLSPDGYKVRATINGQPFMLDKWQPYVVEGLPMGTNTFKLELLNRDGELVDNRFNPVERTITLKAGT